MKKLYLTSAGLEKFTTVLSPKENPTLAFIPNAGDVYKNAWFIERDRKKLKELGYRLEEVDLRTEKNLERKLQSVNGIFVAGGNTFYLLEKMRESGFDTILESLLEKGIVYAGASAGAVVAGPDIEPVAAFDDPKDAPNLQSYEGLRLVDFVILPHYGNPKYEDIYQDTLAKYKNRGYKLITLTDDQAIIVNGDSYEIIKTK